MDPMVRVCFVCLGNICRSPTAEAVMRKLVFERGFTERIAVESAGTAAYHVGERPDPRSRKAGARRGLSVDGSARQFVPTDWQRFDYVLALDTSNHDDLEARAPQGVTRGKLFLLRSFDPASPAGAGVPDPYYGGPDGFDEVIDLCEAACRGLLDHIVAEREVS